MVDSTWGDSTVKQTLEEFRYSGASPEQEETLHRAFSQNYHPVWSVSEVRKFGRACYPVITQAQMFSGEATPLKMRPPFASNK